MKIFDINKYIHNIQKSEKLVTIIVIFFVAIFSLCALALFVKGAKGNRISYQVQKDKTITGPFEGPNSTSRYALTEALVRNHTVFLTRNEAIFSLPDVVLYYGKYFSVFTPGISFIGVPFYILGQNFGTPQLFAYFSVTIFAFFNLFLVARIAYKLGAKLYASLLAGFLFLFATNELSYGFFYTQHATSVTFLLLSFLLVLGKRSVIKSILFGVFAGISLALDVPNIILLCPIGIYFLLQHVNLNNENDAIKFSFDLKFITLLLGLIPFIVFMAWYNFQTTGSYTRFAQSLGQINSIDQDLSKVTHRTRTEGSNYIVPFTPQDELLGTYVLLLSDERSLTVYSPIVLLGIWGVILLYKRQKNAVANILASTILLNILLYSMFDDPWGGWAFGPRYLIPAAAMLCIGLGVAIQEYKKKIWFIILFTLTACYSILVNVIGALTTSAVPTKQDVLNKITTVPYTYLYNIQLVNGKNLSSLIYNFFLSTVSSWTFVLSISMYLILIVVALYLLVYLSHKEDVS